MKNRHPRIYVPAILAMTLFLGAAAPMGAQSPYATCPPLPWGVTSVTVLDSQGRFLGRIAPEKRYWVTLDRIPWFLQQALLAVEDARFYEHGGVDLRGIARAAVKDLLHGSAAEGGSTITQQLIKNKFLDPSRTLDRKVKEAEMAVAFEKQYTKAQILEMYFNEIYYGNGAKGIAQAARLYFDKSPETLTEGECILLAGVPKNPGRYNPFGKPADVVQRREVVLKRMEELHIITPQKRLELQMHGAAIQQRGQAPHILAQIRTELAQRLGQDAVEQGGYEVVAAVDMNLQKAAERALRDGIQRLAPGLQGALVCMDPATGDVLAAVGDALGNSAGLNRAFVSRRQPGSTIKPFIYAAALESGKGITETSRWSDTPAAYPTGNGRTWTPHNFGGEQFGELTLREALAHSGNVVTVKVLDAVGVPSFVDFARRSGLALHPQNGLSLALGTDDVTLKDLVQAYTPLAAQGQAASARTILRIYDRRRQTWVENPPQVAPAMSPGAAYITTQMLKDVLAYGTAKKLHAFGQAHAVAGKTGTTEDFKDAWFVGYTPRLVTGVWVGHDRPRTEGRGFTGGVIAAPIWERFMAQAMASRPAGDFPRPEDVRVRTVDPATGALARQTCPEARQAFYLAGTEPAQACAQHEGDPVAQPEDSAAVPPQPDQPKEEGHQTEDDPTQD